MYKQVKHAIWHLLKAMNDLLKAIKVWESSTVRELSPIFVLARLRSSSLFDVYWQWFRPVGDQTFFYQKRKLAKKLTTESLS